MARDFGGDLYDLRNMTDEDLHDLVVQQLREYPNIDAGWIDVEVKDGLVTLSGRVGTDGEVQVAGSVVSEVIGVERFQNDLVVDETHRDQAPAGADAAVTQNEENVSPLGDVEPQQTDTAAHLVDDVDSQQFGTHDMGQAIRDGTPYTPPDSPTPDGYTSREDH